MIAVIRTFKHLRQLSLNFFSCWPIALILAKRDFKKQFVGTFVGLIWVALVPILYLIIYTFVFTKIFSARWVMADGFYGKAQFAIFLYCGLTIFNFFSNILSTGSSFLFSLRTTISKIPLHPIVLPVSFILNSLFTLIVPILALTSISMFFGPGFQWELILVLLIFAPMALLGMSILMIISSTAVFFRDVIQVCKLLSPLIMFLSPIFYPISAVPDQFQTVFTLNPLVIPINLLRAVYIGSEMPSLFSVTVYLAFSILIFLISLIYYIRLSRGFAENL